MAVQSLADMTWEEVRDLPKQKAVAILPIGAVEAHGPHLPLSTDVIISDAMARDGAEKLSAKGYEAIVMPCITYSAAEYGEGFPGTMALRAETATRVIVDIARSLAKHGIATLALANSHLDPTHLTSLYAAVKIIKDEKILRIVFPDITRKPWGSRLTEEFKSGACHAGSFEGSVVMAEKPDLVREEIRKSLPPNPNSLTSAIREGKTTFEEAGGPKAYFGFPAEATAEEGRKTVAALGSILAESVDG